MNTENSSTPNTISVFEWDLLDVVTLCHAALAQDSPNPKTFYLNQILNITFAYLTSDQKKEIETYLAEKKYLPPVDLKIVK